MNEIEMHKIIAATARLFAATKHTVTKKGRPSGEPPRTIKELKMCQEMTAVDLCEGAFGIFSDDAELKKEFYKYCDLVSKFMRECCNKHNLKPLTDDLERIFDNHKQGTLQ